MIVQENGERLLNAQEVSTLIGCYVGTLSQWYKWAKLHPEHELAQLLPKYQQESPYQKRLWKQSDVYHLIEFRQKLPNGRGGVMGDVTQQYKRKNKKESNNGKEKECSKATR